MSRPRGRVYTPEQKNPYELTIGDLSVPLDVLSFTGNEYLSQPFSYRIQFTSAVEKIDYSRGFRMTREEFEALDEPKISPLDIDAAAVINRPASFAWFDKPKPVYPWETEPAKPEPLRRVYGVITGFQRLSASLDEARYEVILQPRFARLDRGRQYRIYRFQSVPQIVEQILRERHGYRGHDFIFELQREYPRREQVMQYGESDLAFISRLLAEVGIWYRIGVDKRVGIDVVHFNDWQKHFQFGVELPMRPPAGLPGEQRAVWDLQSQHTLVERSLFLRRYDYRQAGAWLEDEVNQGRISANTYGETYAYAEPYTQLGNRHAHNHEVECESAHFFARLRRERDINQRIRLSARSDSPTLEPAQVLKIGGEIPRDFTERMLITETTVKGGRSSNLVIDFKGIPYSDFVCFRPPLLAKPQIAGTIPARVRAFKAGATYSHIDNQGRYRVQFLFDREKRERGRESMLLRLARPYAGSQYGLHLPLLDDTEVAVAFEQGDPDRPYIAHALHDSQNVDLVTMDNDQRNVLRTPANNKLRMDDSRGKEHVKLSTDFAGKSQLNLGHLVDAQRQARGEGFELRTDHWGALRAGKGMFISADVQAKAQGPVLEMASAVDRLQQAGQQLENLSADAQVSQAEPADVAAQLALLRDDLEQLKSAVLLLSAPQGIALTSGKHLQLAAQDNLMLNAGGHADVSVIKRLFIGVGQGVSLFVRKLGIKLIANQGPVQIQAQNDGLGLMARQGLEIISSEDEIRIVAKKKITLNAGGSYITLDPCRIESGTAGDYDVKAAHVDFAGGVGQEVPLRSMPMIVAPDLSFDEQFQIFDSAGKWPLPNMPYKITAISGRVWRGITDSQGFTERVQTATPEKLSLVYGQELKEETLYDEQVRLMTASGAIVSNLPYCIRTADDELHEGVTDERGYTQRVTTQQPIRLEAITLEPPELPLPICCAASAVSERLTIELAKEEIHTNDVDIGLSVRVVRLPEGKSRGLTEGEVEMARLIFGDSIDFNGVRVHHGGWWGFLGMQFTAASPNGNMYYPPSTDYYRDDFSATEDDRDKALFIHEMVHVWQYGLGYALKWNGLLVSRRGGEAYEYELDGRSLNKYNLEQQGEIISDYYVICVLRNPLGVWNPRNYDKSPELLASVLSDFLNNPSDVRHLPL